MIRIALCDDEHEILDEVSQYINKYAEENGDIKLDIHPFDSVKNLLFDLYAGSTYDFFILDVYIGDDLGTSLAKSIRKMGIESPIIFLTTSLEHAPLGYETGTLRYLLKPLQPQKLFEALDAAFALYAKRAEKQIKIKTENGIELINANQILYSESQAHYQHVLFENGNVLRVRMGVSELYTLLAPCGGFLRVGTGYIINLRNVKNVSPGSVNLYNDVSLPVARGKYTEIKNAFWEFQCGE